MALPVRTTMADVNTVCGYLASKPTGATLPEAKAVLHNKALDGRKLSALKTWGLIEENGHKIRITERGRLVAKDKGARRAMALRESVASVASYAAVVERAVHRGESTLAATDVAALWHEHYRSDASENDKTLNDQAICFFHLAEGADLGKLVIGRKGQPTRIELDETNAREFIENGEVSATETDHQIDQRKEEEELAEDSIDAPQADIELSAPPKAPRQGNRVFITHGKNKKVLSQVKEIVSFGKFHPVVAQENETAAKSVPDKVMDDMRTCQAAVIHVGQEGALLDSDGNQRPQVNGNVLIEIGAAMALYGRNFILLVEEGVTLPSNLQGLYECRYRGDELNGEATMKLLKAFNAFK